MQTDPLEHLTQAMRALLDMATRAGHGPGNIALAIAEAVNDLPLPDRNTIFTSLAYDLNADTPTYQRVKDVCQDSIDLGYGEPT